MFGENAIHNPISNLEIRSPYDSEGIVEDWDAASRLWEYSITSRLTGVRPTAASKNGLNDGNDDEEKAADGDGDVAMEAIEEQEKPMSEHPLLMSEPAWNPAKHRAKCMEIALEDWGAPAFWLGKTGVLSAYVERKSKSGKLRDRLTTIQIRIRKAQCSGDRYWCQHSLGHAGT